MSTDMLLCPVCKGEVVGSSEAEDGDMFSCDKCGAVLVVRDKKAFKTLDLQGPDFKKGQPVISV
jgi:hypothetical protein